MIGVAIFLRDKIQRSHQLLSAWHCSAETPGKTQIMGQHCHTFKRRTTLTMFKQSSCCHYYQGYL